MTATIMLVIVIAARVRIVVTWFVKASSSVVRVGAIWVVLVWPLIARARCIVASTLIAKVRLVITRSSSPRVVISPTVSTMSRILAPLRVIGMFVTILRIVCVRVCHSVLIGGVLLVLLQVLAVVAVVGRSLLVGSVAVAVGCFFRELGGWRVGWSGSISISSRWYWWSLSCGSRSRGSCGAFFT